MQFPPKQQLTDLLELLHEMGLQEVVICPGSRSAPLTLGFVRHGCFATSTVIDERAAGYIALGKALASGKPVAVVCTSGTALLNLAPAVAEAFYLRVPMLVLSADRPAAWVDQLDGQTIRQQGALGPHTVFTATLPEQADSETDRWHAARLVQQAWQAAVNQRGPAHLNIPLREPLYEPLPPAQPMTRWELPTSELHFNLSASLKNSWNQARRILLVPGQQAPDASQQVLLQQLLADPRVCLLSEAVANAPGGISQHEAILRARPAKLQPDLLISWGQQVVSKQLKLYLRQYPASQHWRIDALGQIADPFASGGILLTSPVNQVLQALSALPPGNGDYQVLWQTAQNNLHTRLKDWFAALPFGDMAAFDQLSQLLPAGHSLHLGNSTPIRHWQNLPHWPALHWVHANRGTSGIDGVNSTALGFASQRPETVWLLTGELSFAYDLNAFSSSERPTNLRVVVFNNGGGDIFRQIPGPKTQPEREDYFATPRSIHLQAMAAAWGLPYLLATDAVSLQQAVAQMQKADGCQLLEIRTEPSVNESVYNQYLELINSHP